MVHSTDFTTLCRALWSCCVLVAGGYFLCKDTFSCGSVEVIKQMLEQLNPLNLSEMEETLRCLPQKGIIVHSLCQAFINMDTNVFKTLHPLHMGAINIKGLVDPLLIASKVHEHLLSLGNIQEDVVISTAECQSVYFISKAADFYQK